MISRKMIAIASLTGLLSLASVAAEMDPRLVGTWEGQRDKDGRCPMLAWRVVHSADGHFTISFFDNADHLRLLGKESGQWETAGSRMTLRTEGVPTPEVYNYVLVDENTARMTLLTRDPSADCEDDYEFTDHRVAP